MAPIPTIPLGGSASSIAVGRVAFGCMGMSWCDPSQATPDSQAFETIRTAVDSGSNFLNTGAFYGPQSDPYANLKLLRRFYEAHPEYKAKTVLSVKGGMSISGYKEKGMGGLQPDSSVEGLEADLKGIREQLGTDQGGKEIDVYEMARRDPRSSVKQIMYNMLALSSETYTDENGKQVKGKGLFGHISLSELGLESIKEAVSVAPIACVELEVSPWELDAFNLGIVDYCAEQKIPILAYSPTGKGILSGNIQKPEDLPENDIRRHMDRLNGENLAKNLELANEFKTLAAQHQPEVTPTQLGLAWLIKSSDVLVPLPGTSKAARAKENADAANIELDAQTMKKLDDKVKQFKTAGGRYNKAARDHLALWG
ncbi:NADP-dependent oxidoreductase domain protein [Kalmanozyma brasiliensis GHG001]|uniref:NADP-dependent oxidoreductase domain-containing protein n=1 Tax=Kalmanozyma brasiliensis (strain GHG001) TaxID=1365824 RepID=V5ESW7_KALBG|nr:NADP-dependent oxidoreductase domain protein [Kalmanozyma brasiliensis GHG001]EST05024.1 NADP-dependent oxidoreductase domain protein [Kalmanozyma brasiliensis GHG001]